MNKETKKTDGSFHRKKENEKDASVFFLGCRQWLKKIETFSFLPHRGSNSYTALLRKRRLLFASCVRKSVRQKDKARFLGLRAGSGVY